MGFTDYAATDDGSLIHPTAEDTQTQLDASEVAIDARLDAVETAASALTNRVAAAEVTLDDHEDRIVALEP